MTPAELDAAVSDAVCVAFRHCEENTPTGIGAAVAHGLATLRAGLSEPLQAALDQHLASAPLRIDADATPAEARAAGGAFFDVIAQQLRTPEACGRNDEEEE